MNKDVIVEQFGDSKIIYMGDKKNYSRGTLLFIRNEDRLYDSL